MHKALTTAWVALKRVWPFRPPSVGGVPIRALCVGLVVACLVPTFVLAALLAQQLEGKRSFITCAYAVQRAHRGEQDDVIGAVDQ